jgi:hypothetical protein
VSSWHSNQRQNIDFQQGNLTQNTKHKAAFIHLIEQNPVSSVKTELIDQVTHAPWLNIVYKAPATDWCSPSQS